VRQEQWRLSGGVEQDRLGPEGGGGDTEEDGGGATAACQHRAGVQDARGGAGTAGLLLARGCFFFVFLKNKTFFYLPCFLFDFFLIKGERLSAGLLLAARLSFWLVFFKVKGFRQAFYGFFDSAFYSFFFGFLIIIFFILSDGFLILYSSAVFFFSVQK